MKRNALSLFAAASIFVLARTYLAPEALIVLVNGLLAGSIASLLIVMRSLTWNTIIGRLRYRDATTFTLGLMLVVMGSCSTVATSIYIRAIDTVTPAYTLVALARYCEICGFLFMAYSPDIGIGLFEGRDRKAIAFSIVVGVLIAAGVIYAQAFKVLS